MPQIAIANVYQAWRTMIALLAIPQEGRNTNSCNCSFDYQCKERKATDMLSLRKERQQTLVSRILATLLASDGSLLFCNYNGRGIRHVGIVHGRLRFMGACKVGTWKWCGCACKCGLSCQACQHLQWHLLSIYPHALHKLNPGQRIEAL